ncbi:kinase-like domain-containing protein [Rhizophagus irregularis DAOM 181602=DAOM 197198]|nr:kinase-like domain-containing protein [Rhizophagus irregularis DAOM 181602=DAOM 197198]
MHKRVDCCPRIIHILGISFDENHKIKLAYQITEGIKYLHGENILHQDLHSKNIVIHQNNRSWYSKKYRNRNTSSFGFICLGVLMWELSSGHPQMLTYSLIKDERPSIEQKYSKRYDNNFFKLIIRNKINKRTHNLEDKMQLLVQFTLEFTNKLRQDWT